MSTMIIERGASGLDSARSETVHGCASAAPPPDHGDRLRAEELRLGVRRFNGPSRIVAPTHSHGGFRLFVSLSTVDVSLQGADMRMRRGDMALIDLSVATTAKVGECASLVLTVSRPSLSDVFGGAPQLPPIRLPREVVSVKILRSTLFSLLRTEGEFRKPHGSVLGGAVLDLLGDAVHDGAQYAPAEARHRVVDLIRLSRTLRSDLANQDLSILGVARQLGWPPARLEALLEGRPLAPLVKIHRLRAARRVLRSAAGRHLSIIDIAESVGFNHLSQFSSCYSKAFGVSPRVDRFE